MKIKEIQTILEYIIDIFNDNPNGLTTKEIHTALQNHFSFTKTLRSLELTYLPKLENGIIDDVIFIRNNRGKHQLIDNRIDNKDAIQRHRDKLASQEVLLHEEKIYMRLALEAIKKLSDISTRHHQLIENRFALDEIESPYFIENKKIEYIDSSNTDFIELKTAIKNDNLIEFKYSGYDKEETYIVEPYKFIIFDGLWYLYGKDTEEIDKSPYKTWRYKYIHDLQIELRESFRHQVPDDIIEKYLAKIHSPHSTRGNELHIKIKIHPKILKSFNPRVHLPGYIKDRDNDKYTFSAIVSNIKDIDPEIKSWLPYITVLEPLEYKQQLKKELEKYLETYS